MRIAVVVWLLIVAGLCAQDADNEASRRRDVYWWLTHDTRVSVVGAGKVTSRRKAEADRNINRIKDQAVKYISAGSALGLVMPVDGIYDAMQFLRTEQGYRYLTGRLNPGDMRVANERINNTAWDDVRSMQIIYESELVRYPDLYNAYMLSERMDRMESRVISVEMRVH